MCYIMSDTGPDFVRPARPAIRQAIGCVMPLFAFGTLKDPAVLHALFGCEPPMRPAVFPGRKVLIAADGYLCLQLATGSTAEGMLLQLSLEQLRIADQWEEIPLYRRRRCQVQTSEGMEEAYFYDRATDSKDSVAPGATSTHPTEAVVAAAKVMRERTLISEVPYCDIYLLLPCRLENGFSLECIGQKALGSEVLFLERLAATSSAEFTSSIGTDLKRVFLASQEVVVIGPAVEAAELGRQRASPFLTIHESTRLGVVTLMLPGATVPPLYLLDQMLRSDLQTDEPGGQKLRSSLQNWLLKRQIRMNGTPRAALFLSGRPSSQDVLVQLLAAEADSPSRIVGRTFQRAAKRSVAQ
jgi:hypothetical protein